MALNKRKTLNIITIAVGALAVVLVTIVILVKTGVISTTRSDATTTDGTVLVSEVVELTSVNDDGEIEYYTMINYYVKPSISSNHSYPYVPTTTKATTTEETKYYVEMTKSEAVTDENGEPVTDENGEPVVNIITYTVETDENGNEIKNGTTAPETTTETTTEYVQKTTYVAKTDPVFKRPIKDIHGNVVTELVTLDRPPTTTTTTTAITLPSITAPTGVQNTLPTAVSQVAEPVTEPSTENSNVQ